MNKWGSVNYGNCISYTAGGGGGVWGQWWFEVRMVTSQGTNSRDGRPGNRSLSLLFAGMGTICRTEPAEIPGARGEPFWGMRSRLAQGLWDQREQCFATKSGFLVHSDTHLKPMIFKTGHKRAVRRLWKSHFWKLSQIISTRPPVLPFCHYSSQAASPFNCLRCLGKKTCT